MLRLEKISSNIKSQHLSTNKILKQSKLINKTIVITGSSRGIGLAIAKRCAQDGANIVIIAKTTQPHPKLPGTIYTAAQQIENAGGKALPLKCDIRSQSQIQKCIQEAVGKFGGIDILINNASAISLTTTLHTDMKKYDLMHSINSRGTFLVSKCCLPYLLKSKNPHILNIAPPLILEKQKFAQHLAYTISKIGMSIFVHSMAEEFKQKGIVVNALWPKKSIATATIKNFFGGYQRIKKCRKDSIMADAAYLILTNNDKDLTGKFYLDEQILRQNGTKEFSKYDADQQSINKLKTHIE